MTRIALLTDARYSHNNPAVESIGSDLALARRCAQRDPAAMREIVQRYQQKLYRFLSRLLDSHEDTEEAVLDVFLRVWQQAHRFEGRSAFSTWLYRIASNVAYDILRRRKGQCPTTPLDDHPAIGMVNAEEDAVRGLEREERAGQLHQALQALRVDDRVLLVLYYVEDLGYAEIGAITGYPAPLLKVRLMRARRRLRAVMETQMPEVKE